MYKLKLISIALVCSMLCSCGNSANTNDNTAPADISGTKDTASVTEGMSVSYEPFEDDYFEDFEYVFDSRSNVFMSVSDDGRIATLIPKSVGVGSDIVEFALDGTSKKIGSVENYPDNITYMGDEVFVVSVKWGGGDDASEYLSDGIMLYKLNTETKSGRYYDELAIPITMCTAFSGNKDELYIFGDDPTNKTDLNTFAPIASSLYLYKNGEAVRLPFECPTAVCAMRSGGAIVAARDEGGYFVAKYKDGELYDKVYANTQAPITGIADVDGKHVVFTVFTESGKYMLCASDISNMYNAELIPGVASMNDLFSAGGLCFYQPPVDKENNKCTIRRVQFSKYFTERPPMNLITTDNSLNTPYGCGYTIVLNKYSDEEAALKILSLDKDYDMCYINTASPISYSLRSKGSFYPLNDVAGVSDYLDKCFPSIKSAFTNEQGEIWALPIWTNMDCIFSNYGDTDFTKMKLCDFVDYIDGLSEEEYKKVYYSEIGYTLDILKQYVVTHDKFDTPEFREAAEKLKNSKRLNVMARSNESRGALDREEHLMTFAPNLYGLDLFMPEGFTVSGIPCVSDTNTLIPDVLFLCVNPSSEHLDDALEYISKITEYQLAEPDQFMLTYENGVYSDSDTLKQMTDLCGDMSVYFTYPDELYLDDFREYLAGNITLDSFIKETDRKLRTYLNE